MGPRIQVFLLLIFFKFLVIAAVTNNMDFVALKSLMADCQNTPPNWVGTDPCGDSWEGIKCTYSDVTSITLSSTNLNGQLPGDIGSLSQLQTLDLSYNKGLTGPLPPSIGNLKNLSNLILVGCSFSGPIPDTIGSLQQLIFLSLNSNSFIGEIPPSIGNLFNLNWLDLTDNKLTGTIPVSNGTAPGLDMLLRTMHFHLGKNQLSGSIPSQLFSSKMILIHVLFDGNQLTGSIPSTLGLVQNLIVVRLDGNKLSGHVPSNLNNLINANQLFLSNNQLTGPVPNLTGMNLLNSVDMSNNSFDMSDVPQWFSTLQSLTKLMMENTRLQGEIPVTLFSLPQLETVVLRNNRLNGTFDIGTVYSKELKLIDLQENFITDFKQRPIDHVEIKLFKNPFCKETGRTEVYCIVTHPQQSNSSYSTPPNNCVPVQCSSDKMFSPNCKCSYPYMGTLFFVAPSFSDWENSTHYPDFEKYLMHFFESHQLPVDSVSLSRPTKDSHNYLELSLDVFPSGLEYCFNRTEVSVIGFMLSNQTFKAPIIFGPYQFKGQNYGNFPVTTRPNKSSSIGIVIGTAAGVSVLALLLLLAGIYAFRQKRRAERATQQSNPFASWDSNKSSGSIPQLKGARRFSFEELKKCTNKFSEANNIGSGGYGKVYRGSLPIGQLIAIKRAQQGSRQGSLEFKTEIELLSRVHHKNLVSLVGFCYEKGEQMLVYEYIPNGTLKESLSGKSGIRLDWMRRLRVALGAARGLTYLHELANPPIIHRDIKSTNVLLDERLNAKVADFGLSKPMDDTESHVSTQVKGTMGYVDPEYYMTQQLTEKSDVYSFGVVMLELITAKRPIERGRYIVREVKTLMDKTKVLYNLHEILDPAIGLDTTLGGLEKFVDLAMRCVEEAGAERPKMGEVVNEIENIMLQLAGLNPGAELASTSASYEEETKGNLLHPYINDASFDYREGFPPPKIEPQ